jgi:excisionase family DNA binding protein
MEKMSDEERAICEQGLIDGETARKLLRADNRGVKTAKPRANKIIRRKVSAPTKIDLGDKIALRIDEAAVAAGLSRTTIHAEISAGRLKSVKRGGRRLILREDLEEFLRVDTVATKPIPFVEPKDASQASSEVEAPLDAEATRSLALVMPDGERTICSRLIADFEGKEHKFVMLNIRNIVKSLNKSEVGNEILLASLEGFYIDKLLVEARAFSAHLKTMKLSPRLAAEAAAALKAEVAGKVEQ